MKRSILSLAILVPSLALVACKESTEPASTPPAAAAAADKAAAATTEAAKTVEATANKVAAGAQDAAKTAASTVTDAAAAVSGKVKEALANAQGLLTQGKFQEAQDSLKSLADVKLPADQQKLVDDIKAKIQQAITASKAGAGDATKAVQGLLPK